MKRFLLLLLLSVPVFLLAQSAMSLDDCIRLAYKQNPAVRNGVIGIKETKADYIASVGAFLPHIVVNAETGKRFGRSLDPDTNGYTSESFEEGTVGLDMTLSLFEGFSRINQVRFRKMNKERSEWELKEKQNELAYQVTDAYYKLILERKSLKSYGADDEMLKCWTEEVITGQQRLMKNNFVFLDAERVLKIYRELY